MTTFAIIGVAGALGRALAARLDDDPTVTRIVGIDRRTPQMPPAKLDFVRADVRDPVLTRLLGDVDVLVHHDVFGEGHEAHTAHLVAHVTRALLDAASAAGVTTIVHVSTALVYGATETNPVPLREDVAPTPHLAYPPALRALLVEDVVADFARARPDVRVAVLRPVAVLGVGVESVVTRHLESPVVPLVRGYDPPVQFVDVDDLAAAVHLVATTPQASGVYNVAADGWLTTSDVRHLLGRPVVHLPEQIAVVVATTLHRWGVLTTPPEALPYLMHPWVVDTARLRALGWSPVAGHRDILHHFVDDHGRWLSVGRLRVRTARMLAAGLGVATLIGLGVTWVRRLAWSAVRSARRPR